MKAADDQGFRRMSVDQLRDEWARLNDRYFGGTLPVIHIEWSRRLTASAGMFLSRIGPRARTEGLNAVRGPRRLIRLSLPLLRNEPYEEVAGTLAHEMIHQWQYDVLRRRPNHGAEFRDMMAVMNRDGLGITVRHSLDGAVQALARYAWRCQECGRDYHRQRRTIQPKYHRCGDCHGRLSELPLQRVNARSPSRHDASGGANVDAAFPRRRVSAQLALPFEEAVYYTCPPQASYFTRPVHPPSPRHHSTRPPRVGQDRLFSRRTCRLPGPSWPRPALRPWDAPFPEYTRPPQAVFPPARPDPETGSFPNDAPFPDYTRPPQARQDAPLPDP